MSNPIVHVQPPLEFIPPNFNPLVLRGAQMILPFWLRSQTSITDIKADNVETLVDMYRQFQEGKIRFLMAFRHPAVDDPLCMLHLLSHTVPKVARQHNLSLKHPIHAHFIYDRGIPLWAGSWITWLYPRMGGTPILRGKVDRMGLRSVRELFANGTLPMAAAPEGATNGHNEIVSPLEPGIAQMGFWCVEDLLKAGRSEKVFILPVGIQYRYFEAPWKAIEKLLRELETACGLPVTHEPEEFHLGKEANKSLYTRLYRLAEHFLTLMEDFYTRFYHQTLPTTATTKVTPTDTVLEENILRSPLPLPTSNAEFSARLQALLDTALRVAEEYFNLQPKGSLIDRCRRLEQAGWDYIYREDLKNIEALSPLERGLADRIAEEASLRMWHMRLVESFVAVTGAYVWEKTTAERFAETTLLMWDVMARIKGGSPFRRPSLGKQWVQMTVGEPLSVSDRWETYQASRRGAKQSVADLTHDLQVALQNMIS